MSLCVSTASLNEALERPTKRMLHTTQTRASAHHLIDRQHCGSPSQPALTVFWYFTHSQHQLPPTRTISATRRVSGVQLSQLTRQYGSELTERRHERSSTTFKTLITNSSLSYLIHGGSGISTPSQIHTLERAMIQPTINNSAQVGVSGGAVVSNRRIRSIASAWYNLNLTLTTRYLAEMSEDGIVQHEGYKLLESPLC